MDFLGFLISNKLSGSVISWVKILKKWAKDVHVNLEAQLPGNVVTRGPCRSEPSSSIESLWCLVHGVHDVILCENDNSGFTLHDVLFLVCVIEYFDKMEGTLESIVFSVHGEWGCPLETAASAGLETCSQESACSFLPPKCYSRLALQCEPQCCPWGALLMFTLGWGPPGRCLSFPFCLNGIYLQVQILSPHFCKC